MRYRQGNGEHKFLHKFKQCFLQNISVNYTADGTYATYDDGTPVSMIMDLTFKEIEPIYDIDKKTFRSFIHNSQHAHGLHNNYILSLYLDRNNTIWVGSWGGG